MATKTKTSHFQTLVIGGGLTGLCVAHGLSQKGERVAVIEELDHLGGDDRPHLSTFGPIDHGLKVIPGGEDSEKALEWLKQWLPELSWQTVEAPPVTYESSQLKPFVGFGAKALEAASEIHHYTAPTHLKTNLHVHQWVEKLVSQLQAEVFLKSFVTFIEHDDATVRAIRLNGKDTLTADRFIYCGQPKELLKYALSSAISPRVRQKLSKAELFTSLGLELFHSQPITSSLATHVLWSPSDEGAPCIGVFHEPQQNSERTVQHSQWMTFVPLESTDDNEVTGAAIRKIKKQVKRAYASAFDNLHGEIIVVGPGSHGTVDWQPSEDQLLPTLTNFHVASPAFVPTNPVIGALLQAQEILNHWPETQPVKSSEQVDLFVAP